MIDWVTSQLNPGAAGFWLLVDVVLGAVAFLWLPHAPVRWQSLLRALRWLLIPWAALMFGALSPQSMGLTHNSWQQTLTTGLGILLTMLVLVVAARYTLRATGPESEANQLAYPEPHRPFLPLYAALFHGMEQFHWCFQRAAVALVLLSAPVALETPAYWAIWIATLIALPGILVYRAGAVRLYALVALLTTAILFFYSNNFWLCWLLHAGIMILAGSVHTRPELEARTS